MQADRHGSEILDNAQGLGRVSITASIRNITDQVNCGYQPIAGPVAGLAQGKSVSYPINILKAPKDGFHIVLKATMCYNDVGGTTDLANVLNLKVTQDQGAPGAVSTKVKYGNTQSDKADGLNNVQKVVWKDIQPGPAALVVECAAIRLPTATPTQDYALAWSIDYVDPGLSLGQILLYSALGALPVAALVAFIVFEAHH